MHGCIGQPFDLMLYINRHEPAPCLNKEDSKTQFPLSSKQDSNVYDHINMDQIDEEHKDSL